MSRSVHCDKPVLSGPNRASVLTSHGLKRASRVVIRFLAAIVFLVWTACYVRCATEISGLGKEVAVDACCQHEQPETARDCAPEQSVPCGICDAIVSGGLVLSQPFVMVALILSVLAVVVFALSSFRLRWLRLLDLARSQFRQCAADPPWREPRLWEFLVRTACPVRGPSLALA